MSKDEGIITKDVAIEKMVCLLMTGMNPMPSCIELGIVPGAVRQWLIQDKTLYELFVAAMCFSTLRYRAPDELNIDDKWISARRETADREMKIFLGLSPYNGSIEVVEDEKEEQAPASSTEEQAPAPSTPIHITININDGIHIH